MTNNNVVLRKAKIVNNLSMMRMIFYQIQQPCQET